jgi:acetyl esterase/lipase
MVDINKKYYLVSLACCLLLFCGSYRTSAQDSTVISLWKNGAPGYESRKNEPEQAKDWWVKNINNPSVTFFPAPNSIATGAAVVICPGGGHRTLVFNAEGTDAARFLNGLGISAFVLKYRLFREDSTVYTMENAKQDVFRAIRLVRSLATAYHLDTSKIGIMGFSAGGELAGWLSYHFTEDHALQHDAVDALPARPDFQVLIYPGPAVVPDTVPGNAPPTFLLAANDDACCSEPVITLLQMHRKAKVPVEVHLYKKGDHGFNMGKRSTLKSIHSWPDRLADWLNESGISHAAGQSN